MINGLKIVMMCSPKGDWESIKPAQQPVVCYRIFVFSSPLDGFCDFQTHLDACEIISQQSLNQRVNQSHFSLCLWATCNCSLYAGVLIQEVVCICIHLCRRRCYLLHCMLCLFLLWCLCHELCRPHCWGQQHIFFWATAPQGYHVLQDNHHLLLHLQWCFSFQFIFPYSGHKCFQIQVHAKLIFSPVNKIVI